MLSPATQGHWVRFTVGDVSHFAPSTERCSPQVVYHRLFRPGGSGMVDDVFHGNLENAWPTGGMSVNDTKLRTSEETHKSPPPNDFPLSDEAEVLRLSMPQTHHQTHLV
jgi:hypothetical protein